MELRFYFGLETRRSHVQSSIYVVIAALSVRSFHFALASLIHRRIASFVSPPRPPPPSPQIHFKIIMLLFHQQRVDLAYDQYVRHLTEFRDLTTEAPLALYGEDGGGRVARRIPSPPPRPSQPLTSPPRTLPHIMTFPLPTPLPSHVPRSDPLPHTLEPHIIPAPLHLSFLRPFRSPPKDGTRASSPASTPSSPS